MVGKQFSFGFEEVDLCLVQLANPALANPLMYNPLGISYIASIALERGYKVGLADFRYPDTKIPPARVVAFSCTTPELPQARVLAQQIKDKHPETITVVGGAHPSLFNISGDEFDYIIKGEGEDVISFILDDEPPPEKTVFITTKRIENLDYIPLPTWELFREPFTNTLFPGEKYGTGKLSATIMTSRGCPYACSFCGNMLNTPVIYRSPLSVELEIEALLKRGVSHYRFDDDNFTLNPRFWDICDMLLLSPIHFKCHTRSDLLTKDKAEYLKEVGCEECGLGIESADDKVLKLMNKGETSDDHRRAIKILKDAGIRAKVYLMSGLPGETEETVEINKKFILETKPDKWTLSRFTPYPGCAVFKSPETFRVRISNWDWTKWWNFPDYPVYSLVEASRDTLQRRYLDFYSFLESNA